MRSVPPTRFTAITVLLAIAGAWDSSATVTLVRTTSFTLKDDVTAPIDTGKRRVRFTASTKVDPAPQRVVVPVPGSADDPTLVGAAVVVQNSAGSGESVQIELPAGGWRLLGNSTAPKGYSYRTSDPGAAITRVDLKPDRIVVKGGKAPWTYTLDEPQQQRMALQLRIGNLSWCADAPAKSGGTPPSTAKNDLPGKFLAAPKTPAPAVCPIPGPPACVVVDAGVVPGVTHGAPAAGWAADVPFSFPGAGAHPIREFDSCFGTNAGDPSVCTDTIDYVDPAGQTRRLPYRITAPSDLDPLTDRVPVIVHQHGGGPNKIGQRVYDNLVRVLASHGYVVVQTAVMPCGGSSACQNTAIQDAYCAVFGQTPGSDCDLMNVMYFNRPRDFRATLDALPRIFRTVDTLAGALSVQLATVADDQRVALMGHSAGTNGVLSVAGGRFDYVSTAAGTDVDQRDLFPTAFIAFGPNAHSSDNGRGWDAIGFSYLAADVPFLFVTGSRDYAMDVPACDRPQSYFEGQPGWKILSYASGASHAGAPLNREDNATVDGIASLYWTPDRCRPDTSALRGVDDYATNATTTPLEAAVQAQSIDALVPFVRAALDGDPASLASLGTLSQDTGPIDDFDWSSTHIERRGAIGPDAKILAPRGIVVGSTSCGGTVDLRILRRGFGGAITLAVSGLPSGSSAQIVPVTANAITASMAITRGSAAAGTYVVRVTGTGSGASILGTELTVRLP